MSLVINHNMMATNTARNLNAHYAELAQSTQRLSTGLRVNSAADDAAGLAIRELQRVDISTLQQGARNANDAVSMIQTADGALGVIDEKLTRMKELAEQAATGTYDSTQRLMIDSEFQEMAKEIDRIANSTEFNGIKLLNGNLSGEHDGSGINSKGQMKIHFGTGNDSAEDYYYINIGNASFNSLMGIDDSGINIEKNVYGYNTAGNNHIIGIDFSILEPVRELGGNLVIAKKIGPPTVSGEGFDNGCWIECGSPGVINTDFYNYEVSYDHIANTWSITNGGVPYQNATIGPHANGCTIDLDNSGGGDVYVHFKTPLTGDTKVNFNIYADWEIVENGTNKSVEITSLPPDGLNIKFGLSFNGSNTPDMIGTVVNDGPGSTYNLVANFDISGGAIDVKTQSHAQQVLERIDEAMVRKDKIRANLGAIQNRLENTITNLNVQAENLQAAESRISDVDVSTEMTNFVREQILSQSAVAMLAQANSLPQMAMKLIGG